MANLVKRSCLRPWIKAMLVVIFALTGPMAAADEQMEATFEDIEVSGINTTHDYVIQPGTVSVALSWPAAYFSETLPKEKIDVYMDLKGVGPGVHVAPAKIRLPEKARLIRIEPTLFTVTINPQEKTGTKEK
ncbi:MAG: hypothetical protein ACLFNW_10375 [Desulfobacterales bacterium]